MPVEFYLGDLIENPFFQPIPEGFDAGIMFGLFGSGQFAGHTQPDNARDVVSSRPAVALLVPPVDERGQFGAAADIKSPYPFRSADLVSREDKQINSGSLNIYRNLPDRLYGVGMETNLVLFGDGTDLLHRENVARLVRNNFV